MKNLNKDIWGPLIWNVIHIISTKLNKHNQISFYNIIYFELIPNIIPCNICTSHYMQFIRNISFNKNKDLENKLYHFHNSVSHRLNKETVKCFSCYSIKYSKMCCGEVFKLLKNLINYYNKNNEINLKTNTNNFLVFLQKNKKKIFNC